MSAMELCKPSDLMEAPAANESAEPVRVLLVVADRILRNDLRARLVNPRWIIREAQSGSEALEMLMQTSSEVLLLEPQLPDLDPTEFQSIVEKEFPAIQVLTLNQQGGRPLGLGAFASRMAFELGDLVSGPRTAARTETAMTAFSFPRQNVATQSGWGGMIGLSAGMQRVYHAARLVARRDTTVLIQGESGTGKDLVAQAIHLSSARAKQPFVVINCAAIPEALLEAELFGYTKGAFTGAAQSRIGRLHAAHGGTLFLDEIGDMPYPLQSKILRFLEQGEVQRIGGTDTLKVDCRVVAATNADLKKLVKSNQFREDLYYRLAVFPILLPPLRDRKEDLDLLTQNLMDRFCPGVVLHPAARQVLIAHEWPGNVRELRNVVERASLFADGRHEICSDDIQL